MPTPPPLLSRQSQETRDKIVEMSRTETYYAIMEWLNDRGIDASYNQVRYFVQKHSVRTPPQPIVPVNGYAAKVQVVIDALLIYDEDTFTIRNLRLYGSSWQQVTRNLQKDGMIEPIRGYSPMRWRILASKDKLRLWQRLNRMCKEAKWRG